MPRVAINSAGILIGKADADENITGRTYQVVDDAAYWVLVDAKVAAEIAAQHTVASNTQALWQAAHNFEYAQISGMAIGLLVLGVLQSKPKALAVQGWSKSIWTLYYTRKAAVTNVPDAALQDFTSIGTIPYSIPDLMVELGL